MTQTLGTAGKCRWSKYKWPTPSNNKNKCAEIKISQYEWI